MVLRPALCLLPGYYLWRVCRRPVKTNGGEHLSPHTLATEQEKSLMIKNERRSLEANRGEQRKQQRCSWW